MFSAFQPSNQEGDANENQKSRDDSSNDDAGFCTGAKARITSIAEVVREDFEGKGVEVEILGVDNTNELEISFNWSNGVAWKVSVLGLLQRMSVDAVEQQAHNWEVLL
ncbi:hypothetical protein MMC29_006239 [Sticta canariensis]|nr:hypothetical protein [Sticta canariensis]